VADLDLWKDGIDPSTNLWNKGQTQDALRLLDTLIVRAKQENRVSWIRILSGYAAFLAETTNDLTLARHYYEQVFSYGPTNAFSLYLLADLSDREGRNDLAQGYAAKAYALVAHSQDEADRDLVQALARRWPEAKKQHGSE